jgi:hypothetical protein
LNIEDTATAGVGDNSAVVKKDRKAFLRQVEKIAETEGQGRDAKVKVFLATQEAAANGLISLDKDPHTKQDDAHVINDHYVAASGRSGQYSSNGSKKGNAAKFRTAIKLGLHGPSEGGLDTTARTLKAIKEQTAAGANIYPAFEALVAMGRVQVKTDRALTDAEIVESIQKHSRADKDAVEVAESIRKMLEKLIAGERPDHVQTQHAKVIEAHDALRDYVEEMTTETQKAEVIEMAKALGMTFVAQ